jgi:hypothetical protein
MAHGERNSELESLSLPTHLLHLLLCSALKWRLAQCSTTAVAQGVL